jgi:hypothetical protein
VGIKAPDDPTTPEPFWFLNPQLHRLASVELRFVTQWMDHEKPAQDWIREQLAFGWLPWWADIEVKELDDIRTVVRANRMTFVGSVRRWLFQNNRHAPPIEWATSSTVYIGPSILVGKDPDGFEFPVFDGRGRVHIDVQRIRFHHGFIVRRLCQEGYMRWPEEPLAEPPTEPPKEGTKSDEPTGWQAERALRVMRVLYPPDGKAPRKELKELKEIEAEVGEVLAKEEQGKPKPKPNPSPEVIHAVVAFLGRRDD